jgi:hypothetical protein
MTDPNDQLAEAPTGSETTECAFRLSVADAEPNDEGTWTARWQEPDGRGGGADRSRAGFATREAALAHARRVELAARLNRC